ncbi:hypothetical protein BOTBODRAFT_30437 [Botryobasidium botryosum FD-172 SS1]|uniref:Tyrosine specific protein phosphatases domain-containing protein n=1 Tax=Botryobasidium botryosum (strain FD-172 SS1) TaxID=930990 RepID=A0A067MMP3_BOTB1|nr:hypothetical protein BOTBODRAFT_30437 [Botryobasidium botryosum FD-172 SS1]
MSSMIDFYFPPVDPEQVLLQLSTHPFVSIEGVFNVRDLGGYPSTTHPDHITKSSRVFRAGEISRITDAGKAQLRALGITKIFDLRSDAEIKKFGTTLPSIDGVEIVPVPVYKVMDYSEQAMKQMYEEFADGTPKGFLTSYLDILVTGVEPIEAILKHIRDRPNEGCLFYCTAGKDRTGAISALILLLAGVADDDIAKDYALSRVGLEPAREMFMSRFPALGENSAVGALNSYSARAETMLAVLEMMREKFGSIENFLKIYTSLTDDDLAAVRANLLVVEPKEI